MIMLSFDIEEFDVPREKGLNLSLEEEIEISKIGTKKILDILKEKKVYATLFCTSNFCEGAKDLVKRAITDGHEIACHGVDHWSPKEDDPKVSKDKIEHLFDICVKGYRQPRMFDVSDKLIEECGYVYNSSLNPAFIPGKYMHLDMPRTAFMKGKVAQIPASVTPHARIPLFWLSLHDFPMSIYKKMAMSVLKHDGYFTTYFHPWEFVDHPAKIKKYMLPIVRYNNGTKMCNRLGSLIDFFKKNDQEFCTIYDSLDKIL